MNIPRVEQKPSKDEAILNLIADCAKEMCQDEGWFDGVVGVLERLGKKFALSRVYLAENLTKETFELRISIRAEWTKPGWRCPLGKQKNRNFLGSEEGINRWWGRLAQESLLSTSMSDFPQEVRAVLGSMGGGTLLVALLAVDGKPWGFLACYEQTERYWTSEEATVLRLVAGILAAAIERSNKLRQRTQRRERLAELVEEIPEIFWSIEGNRLKLLYVSPSFERMWGCSQKAMSSDPLGFLKNAFPEKGGQARSIFDVGFLQKQKGTSIHEEQFRVLVPDGKTRWISLRCSILMEENKGAGLIMGLATDITEYKRREMRWLTQRESLIREVHHRIKNHLQGLVGLLQQYIHHFPELTQPMQAAISQIAAVAAIHGLQAINKGGQIKLEETVGAICHNAGRVANCPIHFDDGTVALDTPIIIVEQEAVPVALIVNELVLNACKHRDTKSGEIRIWLTASTQGKSAELLIRNEPACLNEELDFVSGQGLGTGLGLVKSLLPPVGARLTIKERDGGVEAYLGLSSPVLQVQSI
ncbi:PAS sensor protein [Nitrosococcus halophilus Nc 4]|uniref:histidine kinase n=1 Tax=Nitrosococcus halophilus (strain Nc4) TaxID=472759 RepID=D5C0D9_NITHN|nr:PAS domain S-box protein [Nitrosococcus halophilus]ADE14465.1 PAS sensor protein [Nitrosococcus halophilus Nc 4]